MDRTIDPLVSTAWLSGKIHNPDLIVVDIRSIEEYRDGHIPGSINVPFPLWTTIRNGLDLEVPDKDDLFKTIGSAGIKTVSQVIIVNKTNHPYPLADANRVADTLIYAGCHNVAVLDGGYEKWVKEARPSSRDPASPKAVEYKGDLDRTMFVSRDYVRGKIGQSVILDTRDPAVYFGVTREPQTARSGHIPGAKCLPAPWVWTSEGTYKNILDLKQMASYAAGDPGFQEIIVYCGVGGYTSTWWFILTQMLGYLNVKFYDGSAQDWTRDPELPVVVYKWE